jgi:amidophosphoribosyltransferase
MAKDVGAKKVIVASCAPPIRFGLLTVHNVTTSDFFSARHSNVYGIDMPSRHELVAYRRDTDEIGKAIGADLVIFQTLPDLISSVQKLNPSITQFDCSVFTGEYVTGGVNEEYLSHIESLRNDSAKTKVHVGGIGTMEGKGGGGLANGVNGQEPPELADGPVTNGSPTSAHDDTIGLFNYRR